MMRLVPLFLAACLTLNAAIEGVVENRTTGRPQEGVTVTLYTVGGAGPEAQESVKSEAGGGFRIDRTVSGPAMLQAAFDGVVYTQMLPPGRPTSGIKLAVYQSTPKADAARLEQHIALLEATASEITVHETYFFSNSGASTYYDARRGTLRFAVPSGISGRIEVTAQAPDGLPIARAPNPAGEANLYSVDFPVKPGETRFDITYRLPYSSPGEYRNRTLFDASQSRLIVPPGITIEGDSVQFLGQEPRTQSLVYALTRPDYSFTVQGTGSLRSASGANTGQGPSINRILPRIYSQPVRVGPLRLGPSLYWVLGLAFGILALGFFLLYRRSAAPETGKGPAKRS